MEILNQVASELVRVKRYDLSVGGNDELRGLRCVLKVFPERTVQMWGF